MAHRLVDVSEHQRGVDWNRVSEAGFAGAFVRVADGDHRDAFFTEKRVRALEKAGLHWGPYYYARVASSKNGQRDGTREAEMAVGFAREFGWGKKDHLRFAYDFEDANDQPPAKVARHAVEFVRAYERLTGEFPVFYTMPGFWQGVVGHLDQSDRHLIGRCPLWIAHWRVEKPTVPKPWNDFCLWQHDDSGRVPGIDTLADVNRTRDELTALKIGSGGGAEPAKPKAKAAFVALREGDSGPRVEELQEKLRALAASEPRFDPGPVDGVFGPKTTSAVKEFESASNLRADGVVGHAVWKLLHPK